METDPRGEAGEAEAHPGVLNIMCWNINCLTPTVRNMELRHKSFRGFMDHLQLDIACFQEVKLPAARITRELACVEGFQSFWASSTSKPGYSGVTTWCRTATAAPRDAAVDCLGGDERPELDTEGRFVLTDHGAFVLLNVYVPNAGDRPERARLPYKLAFLRALRTKMDELTALGRQVVLVGDLNIAAERRDVHPTLDFDSMYDKQELAELSGLIAAYPDVWRHLHPDTEGSYTVWDERTSARAFNTGLRIDYVLVSPGLLPYVQSCEILTAAAIPPKWSDHAAILLTLRVQRAVEPESASEQALPRPLPSVAAMVEKGEEEMRQLRPQLLQTAPETAVLEGGVDTRAAIQEMPGTVGNSSGNGGAASGSSGDGFAVVSSCCIGATGPDVRGDAAPAVEPPPHLFLPPPATAPCTLWRDLEARFVDKNQKTIRDIFSRRPQLVVPAAGRKAIATSPGATSAPTSVALAGPCGPQPSTTAVLPSPVWSLVKGNSTAAYAAGAVSCHTDAAVATGSNRKRAAVAAADVEGEATQTPRPAPALRTALAVTRGPNAAVASDTTVSCGLDASSAQLQQGLPDEVGERHASKAELVPKCDAAADTDMDMATCAKGNGGVGGEHRSAGGASGQEGVHVWPSGTLTEGLRVHVPTQQDASCAGPAGEALQPGDCGRGEGGHGGAAEGAEAQEATASLATNRVSSLPAPRPQQPSRQVVDGYTDSISGFRVSKPVIGSLVLRERLTDDCVYIGLKDISPSRELAGRWATMAVLVSKVQATGRDGSPYCRWGLSDLAGKQVSLFLWRKAASEHYKESEGSVLLLWSPQVRRDEGGGAGGGGGGAGYSLHIDKPEMLQRPGMSADFGLCRGTRKDGQRCTMPINKSTCEYCPYHAQAALRALSSNRSDMAGANLLQRQLLPQARAAQKQLTALTGKPFAGINSLIARPPPSRMLPGAASGAAAAAAAGTGAYGVRTDTEGDVAASGGVVGGKRSYGAQLLANLQERQAAGEEGAPSGPAAKRHRSGSSEAWDGIKSITTPVSAVKARAIAAARAAGQLDRAQSSGAAAVQHTPPAAVPAPPAGTGGRRQPNLSAPRISMPPPLPAHLAVLLKPPATDASAVDKAPEAAVQAGTATRRASSTAGGQELIPRRQRRSSAGAAGRDGSSSSGEAVATEGPGMRSSGHEGAGGGGDVDEGHDDLLVIELEEDEIEEDLGDADFSEPQDAAGTGRERVRAAGTSGAECGGCTRGSSRGSGPEPRARSGSTGCEGCEEDIELMDGEEEGLSSAVEGKEQQQQPRRSACQDAAGPPQRGVFPDAQPGPSGKEACGLGRDADAAKAEGCGLDELLELFPELQDEVEEPLGTGAVGAVSAQQQNCREHVLEGTVNGHTQPPPSTRQQTSATGKPAGTSGPTAAGEAPGAAGGTGAVRAAGTGTPAAAATGLLPRVAGLSTAPAARAAEARKQQAAATKARDEKLKSLGLKTPAATATPVAAAAAPTRPLGAANASGGARPQASGAAAAAALAAAKGLPMPRAGARGTPGGAQRSALAGAAAAATAAAAPLSAMAAAFGGLVKPLPEAAVESRYSELSEEAAGEAVLSMLEGLEARDALVKQLDSISHLKLTAWHCRECNRLSEFLDKQCRADGHTLSKTTTLKRFWTCDHCNARITTLGVRFPANRCNRCNNPSLEFTACTMYRGPRELKPAGMAAAAGLASKDNLFATIDQHPEIGRRTFRYGFHISVIWRV
ncbi:hypothetical protein VOLCADRAFT_104648 [Volvox carteri f. nagariensis]|uniref:Protein MCM10 homolog n=1 Tax=Volvox carteri f. nagariensis TaxID=3068 RepID=D8TVJ4_VOLCA|nr:uncharacterized protein VOLCADRAFT_104648 [Volvox carteri f. nagariensis]EFJ48590.1 hypothetical protein VOLCADRAFT_104648 [Volvox carteri f. nagariensis]|eukprot:XP_002950389.1 hypothetical protein VOLCADRAFT_104648 [Volvox carteri f. nagariensis]